MSIDWAVLSQKLGCEFSGGTKYAQQALTEILGKAAIEDAVEFYITGQTGSELARSVLCHTHPRCAMDYCYRIFKEETDLDRRRMAVELLRVVADEHALKWISEFLTDPDQGIQAWGAGVVDQLLWSGFIDANDCTEILDSMENHKNVQVRERFEFITEFLANR